MAAEKQLDLLGAPRPRLGPNQLAVLDALEQWGTLSSDQAGAVVHARRGKHGADETCAYCAIDGKPVLRSLVTRGVAERAPEGHVQLPRAGGETVDSRGPGELPEGF